MAISKHSITQYRVKDLITRYSENKSKILKEEFHEKATLPVCETFERAAFDELLAQPGCVGIRVYFGMDEKLEVNLVVVGVNEKDQDIQPISSSNKMLAAASLETLDEPLFAIASAYRCPPICPPPPPPPPPDEL